MIKSLNDISLGTYVSDSLQIIKLTSQIIMFFKQNIYLCILDQTLVLILCNLVKFTTNLVWCLQSEIIITGPMRIIECNTYSIYCLIYRADIVLVDLHCRINIMSTVSTVEFSSVVCEANLSDPIYDRYKASFEIIIMLLFGCLWMTISEHKSWYWSLTPFLYYHKSLPNSKWINCQLIRLSLRIKFY